MSDGEQGEQYDKGGYNYADEEAQQYADQGGIGADDYGNEGWGGDDDESGGGENDGEGEGAGGGDNDYDDGQGGNKYAKGHGAQDYNNLTGDGNGGDGEENEDDDDEDDDENPEGGEGGGGKKEDDKKGDDDLKQGIKFARKMKMAWSGVDPRAEAAERKQFNLAYIKRNWKTISTMRGCKEVLQKASISASSALSGTLVGGDYFVWSALAVTTGNMDIIKPPERLKALIQIFIIEGRGGMLSSVAQKFIDEAIKLMPEAQKKFIQSEVESCKPKEDKSFLGQIKKAFR